jgi:hypothetical protein
MMSNEACSSDESGPADGASNRKLIDYTKKVFNISSHQHQRILRRLSISSIASTRGTVFCLPEATRISCHMMFHDVCDGDPTPSICIQHEQPEKMIEFYLKIPQSKRMKSNVPSPLGGPTPLRKDLNESIHSLLPGSTHCHRARPRRAPSFLSRSIASISVGSLTDDDELLDDESGIFMPSPVPVRRTSSGLNPNFGPRATDGNLSNLSIATQPQVPGFKTKDDLLDSRRSLLGGSSAHSCWDLQIVKEENVKGDPSASPDSWKRKFRHVSSQSHILRRERDQEYVKGGQKLQEEYLGTV